MLRDRLIDTAIRLHVDEPLQKARALMSHDGRGAADEHRQLTELLSRILAPGSNCIDIGAYRGLVLREMVRHAPRGRHIAYEPLPHLHRLLVRRFPDVDVRLAAVSNERGETTFTMVRDAPGLSGFQDRWHGHDHQTEAIPVRLETLDEDLPPDYVPHFIKIDVEGAERLVFEGAMRTLADHKPTILFEHGKGGADHYATAPSDVYRLLADEAGLRIFSIDDRRRALSRDAFEAEFHRNEQWNFLACA
ncbi:MAG: FkbM family methyltransferase [Solirubrobacteraceae bacterium]